MNFKSVGHIWWGAAAKIALFGFCCIWFGHVAAQVAYIDLRHEFYDNSFEGFKEMAFVFNGTKVEAKQAGSHPFAVHPGITACQAIYGGDTMPFFAAFHLGQTYVLKPGCCCAAFTLQPANNLLKGTVSLKNSTKEALILTVCEHNADTILPGQSTTLYASESAMCLFKPCRIILAKPAYFDPAYETDINGQLDANLKRERDQHLYKDFQFQFLHGENLWLEIKPRKNKVFLQLGKPWEQQSLDSLIKQQN